MPMRLLLILLLHLLILVLVLRVVMVVLVGMGGDEVLRGHGGIPVRVVRVVRGGVRRASVSGPRSRASP